MHGLRTVFVVVCLLHGVSALAEGYREIEWDALMPPGWEPDYSLMAPESEFDLESEAGSSLGMDSAMDREMENEIDSELESGLDTGFSPDFPAKNMPAPVVDALSGEKLKIPGYVIPIKYDGTTIEEFLLVPYMGACIHVPPPPENQMVYVVLKEPLVSSGLWEPVWVSGEMKIELSETQYATAGYRMVQATIEPYEY